VVIIPQFCEEVRKGDEPLCLRFTNTVGSRGTAPEEHLKHPSAFSQWLVKQKVVPGPVTVSAKALGDAIEYRESLYRLFGRVAEGEKPAPADLGRLNGEVERAVSRLAIDTDLKWEIRGVSALDRALMLISLSAAGLLGGPLISRLRTCGSETCGWLFLDHSKNRSRRWCDMSDCGNRAKARRFQQRKKLASHDSR